MFSVGNFGRIFEAKEGRIGEIISLNFGEFFDNFRGVSGEFSIGFCGSLWEFV